jgi:hypothetical protein
MRVKSAPGACLPVGKASTNNRPREPNTIVLPYPSVVVNYSNIVENRVGKVAKERIREGR